MKNRVPTSKERNVRRRASDGPSRKRKHQLPPGQEDLNAKRKKKAKKSSRGKKEPSDKERFGFEVAPEPEMELQEEDMEAFEEYGNHVGFLAHMDPEALAPKTWKQQKKEKKDEKWRKYLERKQARKAGGDGPERPPAGSGDALPVAPVGGASDSGSEPDSADEVAAQAASAGEDTDESAAVGGGSGSGGEEIDVSESEEELEYGSDAGVEEWYEKKRARQTKEKWEQQTGSESLPMKTRDGKLKWQKPDVTKLPYRQQRELSDQTKATHPERPASNEDSCSEESGGEVEQQAGEELRGAEALEESINTERWVLKQKELVAGFASLVLEDSEEYLSNVGEILDLYQTYRAAANVRKGAKGVPKLTVEDRIDLEKITLVSLLALFLDIIPGYRISHVTDPNVQLSRDVKKLRNHEQNLLKYYREYIRHLQGAFKACLKNLGNANKRELGMVAVKCFVQLMNGHPHFNFHQDIVKLAVQALLCSNGEMREEAVQGFTVLFEKDKGLYGSAEAVRETVRLMKLRDFHGVHPRVLAPWLHLRFTEDIQDLDVYGGSGKEKKKKKKKKGVNKAQEAEVERDMREGSAAEDRKLLKTKQTELLRAVFLACFHIVKRAPESGLIVPVLQCIGKFSHMLNLDFMADLVENLEVIMLDDHCEVRVALQTALAIFNLQRGDGSSLILEHKQVHQVVFRSLPRIAEDFHNLFPVALEVLIYLFEGRQSKSGNQTLNAIMKRLLSCCTDFPPEGIIATLTFVARVLQSNKTLQQILEDSDASMGVHLPDIDDPEHSNAEATSAWELAVLKSHYHPTIRKMAKSLPQRVAAPSVLPSPVAMLREYDTQGGGFRPQPVKPAEHPLRRALTSGKSKKPNPGAFSDTTSPFIQPMNRLKDSKFLSELAAVDYDDTEAVARSMTAYYSENKEFYQQRRAALLDAHRKLTTIFKRYEEYKR